MQHASITLYGIADNLFFSMIDTHFFIKYITRKQYLGSYRL